MSELEHDGVDEEVDEENDEIALDDASLWSSRRPVRWVSTRRAPPNSIPTPRIR